MSRSVNIFVGVTCCPLWASPSPSSCVRTYAPTGNTASHNNHEKINSWDSFSFLCEYGAPLGCPSGRWSSATACSRVNINCIFRCSTRYLTSGCNERVRYQVEQGKIKMISTSRSVIFCSLYKHTNDDVFVDFPYISDHFPKVSEDFQNCPVV